MKKLTVAKAACIVAGNGMGGGMMMVPYLFARTGIVAGVLVVFLAYCVTAALHLMLADMVLQQHGSSVILPVFETYLFRGRFQKVLSGCYFLLLSVVLVANLAAYVAGGGEVAASFLGMQQLPANLLFYAVSIVVPLFGLRSVGVSEQVGVAVMAVVVAVLAVLSFARGSAPVPLYWQQPRDALALFGGVMFCLSALFAVPQVAEGLSSDRRQVRRAVVAGLAINAALTSVVAVAAIRGSVTVTQIAVVGWGGALGPGVWMLASVFILLAMLTSFWAIALALAGMVETQIPRLCGVWGFVVVTLPSFIVTLLGVRFLSFLSVTGGAVAMIVALLLLPAYWNYCKEQLPSGRIPSKGIVFAVAAGYLLMAAGSILAV